MKKTEIVKEIIPYVIIIIVVIVIRTFILTPVIVNGSSMSPTLKGKEVMLLSKLSNIKRFDVVVIKARDDRLIKRVIAMPGETIEIKDNQIFINDKLLKENFGKGITSDVGKRTLKSDEYYVLGDNREDSKDSRFYGPFKKKDIQGSTSFIIYPFKSFGKIK